VAHYTHTRLKLPVCTVTGQNHGFARAIEISRFFRELILVDASEMNNTAGFIFISASKRFLLCLCVFNIRF
jgi:hypothetical protein